MRVAINYSDYLEMVSELYRCRIRPEITSHSFKNGLTVITWSDGTKTKCYCDPEKADEYTGFMICLAKKAFGNDNTASNLADKWLIKIPKKNQEMEANRIKREEELKRIEDNRKKRKAKRERKREIEKIAREIKERYDRENLRHEAEKLAFEKYGIPIGE